MVSSGKTMCEGHIYRNNKMKEFQNCEYPIDYYCKLFNPFYKKEDVLKYYYFSITIENESYSNYYTEKLMDCFATGTVPVYCGTKKILDFFDSDGIIFLEPNKEQETLETLSQSLYISKLISIEKNLKIVKSLQLADDSLFEFIKN